MEEKIVMSTMMTLMIITIVMIRKKISKNVENYILNFHVDDANLSNSEVFEHT